MGTTNRLEQAKGKEVKENGNETGKHEKDRLT